MKTEIDPPIQEILDRQALPPWANWLALDEDGALWVYQAEPHRFDHGWYENEVGHSQRIAQLQAQQDWRDCLWKLDLTKPD